jgi:outer membrane protein assembly factor BamB
MRVSILVFLALRALAFAQTGGWPQFRGPNGSGVAAGDARPPVEFGPTKRMLWRQPVPLGHSSPVVWGKRIFVLAFDQPTKKLELICLAADTGAILWRREAPASQIEQTHTVSNPATASPLVDPERVYAYFGSYGLMAFDHSGEPQWNLPLAMPKTRHGSGASPILANDLLILNHDAMVDGYLLAVDRSTGKQVWKQPYTARAGRVESYSTPVLWRGLLLLHRAGIIEAYQTSDGKLRWSMPASTSGASTIAVSADMIYVNTWTNMGEDDQRPSLPDFATLLKQNDKDGNQAIGEAEFPNNLGFAVRPGLENVPRSQNYVGFKGLDKNNDGLVQESEWESFRTRTQGMAEDHGLLALRPDGDRPQVIWRENTSIPEVPSPLYYRDRIFLIRNGGVITCFDASTGKVLYRTRIGAGGAYFASPVAVAGRIYLASSEGVVTAISADDKQLKVLAHSELGEDIVATPAIAGSVIYVRTLKTVYAFGER